MVTFELPKALKRAFKGLMRRACDGEKVDGMVSHEVRESNPTEESCVEPSLREAESTAQGVGDGEDVYPQDLSATSEVSAEAVHKDEGARTEDDETRCRGV